MELSIWLLLLLLPFALFVLLIGLYELGRLMAWRRERRHHRAMFPFRLLPEELKRKERMVVNVVIPQPAPPPVATLSVEPSPRRRAVCRRSECIALYLEGDLSSWSQERFEDHCRTCVYCKEELARCSEVKARDEICVWERKVRTYIDGRLSESDAQRFNEHRKFCSSCAAAADSADDEFEQWTAEWAEINALKPPSQP